MNKLPITIFILINIILLINSVKSISINGNKKSNIDFPLSSLTFKSYFEDHNNKEDLDKFEKYESIINHLKSLNHNIDIHHRNQDHLIPSIYKNNDDHIATIGSSKLLSNKQLIIKHIENRIPLILLNINDEDKKNLCELVSNVCTMNGNHNILAYMPRTSSKGEEFHRTFNWMNDTESTITTSSSASDGSNSTESVDSDTFNNQYKLVTSMLVSRLVNSDDPLSGLIPPTNTSIPFKYFENTIANSFIGKIDVGLTSKVASQSFSYSVTNHIYLYKDIPNNCVYSIFYQNSYMFPGTKMGVNIPNKAIGSFTTSFGVSNIPSFNNGQSPDSKLFSIESSSPQTVDQTHETTNEVSTEMSLGVSFSIGLDGPSGGASFDETWAASSSVTTNIADYGVNEMTNPYTMETSWMYHQQYPFDVYTSGVNNFGQWYKQAYDSKGNVQQPPSLSTSTLQSSTCWSWRSDSSLINPSTNQLPISIVLNIQLSYSMITCPGFYNSHHKLFYHSASISQIQNYDFNSF